MRHVETLIDHALSKPTSVSVQLALGAGDGVAGRYVVSGAPLGAVVDLALLRRSAVNAISGGENAGSTLHQVNVVLSFRAQDLDGGSSGSFNFALPNGLSESGVLVAAFVHDPETLHVLGRAETP